eukprot:CAMPEP_0177669872 /NCGR_PEP_ID=MMETSP0447-20121125/23727_1 /TAXON_ID=0 /ORGANISM="Stygamoeba regulata, Strain BSH-02190019" /LENGTH=727 /DNA_ID=CAMNT_0019176877 /DNA_START=88 /DNA_END=2271 /DNA_ORIENTATION=-
MSGSSIKRSPSFGSNGRLFDLFLVARVEECAAGTKTTSQLYCYPAVTPEDPGSDEPASLFSSVSNFCFPDIELFPKSTMENERFSFVLTGQDGSRTFGFCRRVIRQANQLPLAFVIMSTSPCAGLFSRMLDEVLKRYDRDPGDFSTIETFLECARATPFPEPGESFTISVPSPYRAASMDRWTYQRPDDCDTALGYLDFEPLLKNLSAKRIIQILVALLAERRVILIADKLSTVSEVVQSAVALLFPFHWQHVFVPILPKNLLAYVTAPFPFVIGFPKSFVADLAEHRERMEDVLIIDVDADRVIRALPMDDVAVLPKHMISKLRHAIKSVQPSFRNKLIPSESRQKLSKLLEGLFSFFTVLLGDFRKYLAPTHPDGFDRDLYIRESPSELQVFLQTLTKTQLFDVFVIERIRKDNARTGRFEDFLISINDVSVAPPEELFSPMLQATRRRAFSRSRFSIFQVQHDPNQSAFATLRDMLKDNGLSPMKTSRVTSSRPPPTRPPPSRTTSAASLTGRAVNGASAVASRPVSSLSARKPAPLPPGVNALSASSLAGSGPKPLPAGYSKSRRGDGPPPLPLKQSSSVSRRTITSTYRATPDKPLQSMGAHRYQPPQDTALRMQPPPRPHRPKHISVHAPQAQHTPASPVSSPLQRSAPQATVGSPPSSAAAAAPLPGLRQPKFRRRAPAPLPGDAAPSAGAASSQPQLPRVASARFTVPSKPLPRPNDQV